MNCSRTSARILSIVILVSFLAPALLAQSAEESAVRGRRRAVRSAAPPSTGGGCVTPGFVRAGLKASYVSTSSSGTATWTVTFLSDNASETNFTEKVVTAAGNADVTGKMTYEPSGSYRALKHLYVKAVPNPSPIPITTETDIDFIPPMVLVPTGQLCAGATWIIPTTQLVTTTKTNFGNQNSTSTFSQTDGAILAVNESLTVQAGTFNTIKEKTAFIATTTAGSGASRGIQWVRVEDGILVKQQSLDANGNVTDTTELTSIQ